jgi:hypothetical protein
MRKALQIGMIGAVAILSIAIVASWAEADVIPPCRVLPNGVSVISGLDDAPPSLAQAVTERVGEVVPAGEMFDSADVRVTGKNLRLIFIWNLGTRWVVAIEHGGWAQNNLVFAFEIREHDHKAVLVQGSEAIPGSLCATGSRLLAIGQEQSLPAAATKDVAK